MPNYYEVTVKVAARSDGAHHVGKAAITTSSVTDVMRTTADMLDSERLDADVISVRIVEKAVDRGFTWR